MEIGFSKYHGTGNDFIIIDARRDRLELTPQHIADMCHRRFGIGADGLMLLHSSKQHDFAMQYFNSDGFEGSMCGNGGRCIAAFAARLGISHNIARFEAVDGLHEADVKLDSSIALRMSDTGLPKDLGDAWFINTGSPHFVMFRKDVSNINVEKEGEIYRHDARFAPQGTNVNFVEDKSNYLFVRTFERGVEAETLSCGTGSVATALCFSFANNIDEGSVALQTRGGSLDVSFRKGKCLHRHYSHRSSQTRFRWNNSSLARMAQILKLLSHYYKTTSYENENHSGSYVIAGFGIMQIVERNQLGC